MPHSPDSAPRLHLRRWLFGLATLVVLLGGFVVGYRSWSVGQAIAKIEANGGKVGTFYLELWGQRRASIGLLGWGDWYSVTFDGKAFGDAEFQKLLHEMQLLDAVVWLQLQGTLISDESMPAVASLANITDLELANTLISDTGLRSLSQLPRLSVLDFSGTRITDAGLAELSRCSELEDLALRGTHVTDASLPHLLAIPKLSTLDIANTPFSPSVITELKAHRPALEVRIE